MAVGIQVTFDAADPHRLARFWADALHYEKEDHAAIAEQLLTAGRLQPNQVVQAEGRAASRDVAACSDPTARGPRLFFQRVPEAKSAKNRVHLDLHVGSESRDREVERLTGLGATYLYTSNDRGAPCVTLQDVEGNELCVE